MMGHKKNIYKGYFSTFFCQMGGVNEENRKDGLAHA